MFDYEFMTNAFAAAGIVAVVSGLTGSFLVMRGQTFAGHALSHIGFAGATGAGLIGLAPLWGLLGFTLAFFAGRTVSYSIYAFSARGLTATSLGDAFRSAFSSPIGIAIQLVTIALLVLATRIDWARRLGLEARDEPGASG